MDPGNISLLPPRPERAIWSSAPTAFTWALLLALLALLFFAVLAYGAVEAWSMAFLQAGAGVLFAAWLVRTGYSAAPEIIPNPLYLPMLCFGVLIAAQLALGVSTYRYATLTAGMLFVAYALLFFVAAQVLPWFHSHLPWLFTGFGFAVALFAIVQDLTSSDKLYWFRRPTYQGWIFGPYVNHNHYAGLMEMLIPFALVPALGRLVRGERRVLLGFAAVVMTASIFLSQSRGGAVAFLVELCLLAAVLMPSGRYRRSLAALVVFIVLVVAFLLWAASANVFHRYETLQDTMRIAMLKDGLRMFTHKPLLGWGLGTFPNAYPAFRSFHTQLFVNAAHNDYLQLLIETGLLGLGLAVWFLVALYRRALRKIANWDTQWSRALRLAALMGCTGLLVHSFVDFNLQIPANAAFFTVLCAVASMRGGQQMKHRRMSARAVPIVADATE